MSTKDLVNEWQRNPQLHTKLQSSFQANPEAFCTKYGITGQEKLDLIQAAKKGSNEFEKRINLFSTAGTKITDSVK